MKAFNTVLHPLASETETLVETGGESAGNATRADAWVPGVSEGAVPLVTITEHTVCSIARGRRAVERRDNRIAFIYGCR